MPLYETTTTTPLMVSKYYTIMVESSQYSVPDKYVDKLLRCKIYTNILLVNCIGKYTLNSVDNAIQVLRNTCPNNISVDKIEFICAKKDDDNIIYLSDYITTNSLNMLTELNDLLNN